MGRLYFQTIVYNLFIFVIQGIVISYWFSLIYIFSNNNHLSFNYLFDEFLIKIWARSSSYKMLRIKDIDTSPYNKGFMCNV